MRTADRRARRAPRVRGMRRPARAARTSESWASSIWVVAVDRVLGFRATSGVDVGVGDGPGLLVAGLLVAGLLVARLPGLRDDRRLGPRRRRCDRLGGPRRRRVRV